MAEMESKSTAKAEELGLTEQKKFDVKKPLRGETSEESQRPASTSSTVKTDKGSFTFKG